MINVDKAYLFGLIIGGGVFGSDKSSFYINLPYKSWGDYSKNPKRASEIATDILTVVQPIFFGEYGINVTYSPGNQWKIICMGNTSKLESDFNSFGIKLQGEMRKNTSISALATTIKPNKIMTKRFLAGLADTIGSTAPSHRRFSDDVQIISFEISGFNYKFVCDLCNLLSSIGCYPDQIVWNHPNIHSTSDPYYGSWKKGFKIRVALDQYSNFGSFAFKSKTISAKDNLTKQSSTNVASPCSTQVLSVRPSTIHKEEGSSVLPEEIRGGHYIHYKHFCAALGCENAPYSSLEKCLACAEEYINPFPILSKYSVSETKAFIASDKFLSKRNYIVSKYKVSYFYNLYKNGSKFFLGNGSDSGYPINEVMTGIGYLIANLTGQLNGKRISGNRDELIENYLSTNPDIEIEVWIPDLLSVLVVSKDDASAMVGAINPNVYKKLISFDSQNKWKMLVREITEKDYE